MLLEWHEVRMCACGTGAVLRVCADRVHCSIAREPRLEDPLFGEGTRLGAGFKARNLGLHPALHTDNNLALIVVIN